MVSFELIWFSPLASSLTEKLLGRLAVMTSIFRLLKRSIAKLISVLKNSKTVECGFVGLIFVVVLGWVASIEYPGLVTDIS